MPVPVRLPPGRLGRLGWTQDRYADRRTDWTTSANSGGGSGTATGRTMGQGDTKSDNEENGVIHHRGTTSSIVVQQLSLRLITTMVGRTWIGPGTIYKSHG